MPTPQPSRISSPPSWHASWRIWSISRSSSWASRRLARHRAMTGDRRPANIQVTVVAWVTPLIKSYNRPREHLWQTFKLQPFAGLDLYSVHLDPPAIGVTGVGSIGFSADADWTR